MLAAVEDVGYRGLFRRWLDYTEPFTDSVLIPYIIVVVEQVGGSMQRAYDFDLVHRNAKSKMQTIERVLYIVQEFPIGNGNDVINLLHLGGIPNEFVKVGDLPLRCLPNELGFRRRACASQ